MLKTQLLYGFVISSKRRHKVLRLLESAPLRPAEMSTKTNIQLSNVSRTLFQLEKKGLVVCLTPEKLSWRVYAITELGKEALKFP